MIGFTPRSPSELAATIDHSDLRPDTTLAHIRASCDAAKRYGFWSVCIPPYYIEPVKRALRGSEVKICTVLGFPHGYTPTEIKAAEARLYARLGVHEIDMVQNVAALKSRAYDYVLNDISAVVDAARGCLVKVILRCSFLTRQEIVKACKLAERAGAAFVKTSTGFDGDVASVRDVALMAKTVPRLGIKAAGGIKTFDQAMAMLRAGATRLGASASVEIVKGFKKI